VTRCLPFSTLVRRVSELKWSDFWRNQESLRLTIALTLPLAVLEVLAVGAFVVTVRGAPAAGDTIGGMRYAVAFLTGGLAAVFAAGLLALVVLGTRLEVSRRSSELEAMAAVGTPPALMGRWVADQAAASSAISAALATPLVVALLVFVQGHLARTLPVGPIPWGLVATYWVTLVTGWVCLAYVLARRFAGSHLP
jgi:hypothetical protein